MRDVAEMHEILTEAGNQTLIFSFADTRMKKILDLLAEAIRKLEEHSGPEDSIAREDERYIMKRLRDAGDLISKQLAIAWINDDGSENVSIYESIADDMETVLKDLEKRYFGHYDDA